ncbi:unnamed protein product, partial [Rotaria magnacalcarata]
MEMKEPLCIVGIGCRFGSNIDTPTKYYSLLQQGKTTITDVPSIRWNANLYTKTCDDKHSNDKSITSKGSFLTGEYLFDNKFFNINPKEAENMDPQQRMSLEVVYETLQDGYIKPETIRGTNTGVFIGVGYSEYWSLKMSDIRQMNSHLLTGNIVSMIANRISFYYDLKGPSFTLDTACSSSLTAFHLACQSLWNKETTMCIVGGSNLCLTPEMFVAFTSLGVLSSDGRCKPFDKQANGYVRGEGITCVILTTLKLANEKNYKIYCQVKASGIAHDGHKTSITTPSSNEQQNLIENIFQIFHIDKETINYFEAHGTGTSVGDPLELTAIANTFSSTLKPIRIGSVKGNIGHTECSAGLASVIKVALMIHNKQLLPTINFHELNTKINFNNIKIQTELESFPFNNKITCCINSFGFGGSNAHVVLQSIEKNEEHCLEQLQEKCILMLSAHSPSSLIETCKKWKEFCLNKTNGDLFQASVLQAFGRSIYKYKVALDFESNDQLLQLLDSFIEDQQQQQISNMRIHHNLMKKDKLNNTICFVFSGQGHHNLKMGTWFYNNLNVFKLKVNECDRIIYELTGKSFIKEYDFFTDKCKLNEEQFSSGSIFITATLTVILQIGLLELLKSWNIVPDIVVGHSIGDIIAIYACGAITLYETIKIVTIRANLMDKISQTAYKGKMMALEIRSDSQIKNLFTDIPDLTISAYNNPNIITVSGPASSIDLLAIKAEQNSLNKRILNVPCAYHSPQMDIIKDEFYHLLSYMHYTKPNDSITFISTTTGEIYNSPFDTNYFWNNIRNPVQFQKALLIAKQQVLVDTVIEIGTSSSLQKILKYYFNQKQLICLTNKTKSECSTMLSAAAALFPRINNMNIENVFKFISKEYLFYIRQNNNIPTISWDHNKYFNNMPEKVKQKYHLYEISQIDNDLIRQPQEYYTHGSIEHKYRIIKDHVFDNRIIFPGAGYLSLVSEYFNNNLLPSQASIFENVQFLAPLFWDNDDKSIIPQVVQDNKNDNTFKCIVKNVVHCKGKVKLGEFLFQQEEHLTLEQLKQYKPLSYINNSEHRKDALRRLFDYGTEFLRVDKICILNEYEVFTILLKTKSHGFKIHPGVLDSILQSPIPILDFKKALPIGIEYISIKQGILDANQVLFAHSVLSKRNSNTFYINATVYNERSEIVLVVKNFIIKDILSSISYVKVENWIFTNTKQSKYIPLSIWQDMEVELLSKNLLIEDIIKLTIKKLHYLNPKRIFRLLDIGSNLYSINQDEIICDYVSIVQKFPRETNNNNSNLIDKETWSKISKYNLNSFDFIITSSTNWSLTDIVNYITPYGWIFYPSELNVNLHFDKQFRNIPSMSDKWNKWTAIQIIPANKNSSSLSFVILVDSLTLKIAEEFQKQYNSMDIRILNINEEEEYQNITETDILIDLRSIYSPDIYNTVVVFRTLSRNIFIITIIDQETSSAIKGLCRVAKEEINNKKIIYIEISNINNIFSENFLKIIQRQYGEEFEYFLDKSDEVMVPRIIKHEINNYPHHQHQHFISVPLKSDGYYLITGAFGGIGLHIALWASTKGAKKFIFSTTSNAEEKQNNPIINYLRDIGCEIIICKCDITSLIDVKIMIHTRKICGIFHMANRLEDCSILSMNPERISNGFNPKAIGAKNLYDATIENDVELFIMFSSLASIFGNIGQAIYCSANAYLTSIAKLRHEKNLHALIIHLPVIENSGYLNNKNHQKELLLLKQRGWPCAKIIDLTKLLDIHLANNTNKDQNEIIMTPDNMNMYLELNKNCLMYIHNCNGKKIQETKDNILSNLFIAQDNSVKTQKKNLHQQVKTTTRKKILELVKRKIMEICGLSEEDIQLESQLSDLTFDSLTATTLSNWIKNEFNRDITQEQLFSSEITLQDLIKMIDPEENFRSSIQNSSDHESNNQIHKILHNEKFPRTTTTTRKKILELVKRKIMEICGLSEEDIQLESQLSDL